MKKLIYFQNLDHLMISKSTYEIGELVIYSNKKKRDQIGLSFYIKTFKDFTISIQLSKFTLFKPSQSSV